jgi:hypothetical protein
MLTPCIPGQIADGAMILMPVVAVVGKNDVGIRVLLYFFKEFLDSRSFIGKEAIAKGLDDDSLTLDGLEKKVRTGAGFTLAFAPRAEDHPDHLDLGVEGEKVQNGSTAPNLNIIGMGPQTQYLEWRLQVLGQI